MAKHKPYRYFIYLLLRLLSAIVLFFPRRMNYAIAHGLGFSIFWLLKKERAKMAEHLRAVFGGGKTDRQYRQIGRRVFIHLAKSAMDVLCFSKLNRARIEKMVLSEGCATCPSCGYSYCAVA